MGIFSLIFGSFTRKFEGLISASIYTVVQQLVNKSRKALLMVVASFVFAVLLAAGIIISVLEASAQYDTRGMVYFSALLTSGTILSFISLSVLIFILWPRSKSIISASAFQTHAPPPRQSSPLEDTFAVLINEVMNYVKERNKPEAPTTSSTEKPNDPNYRASGYSATTNSSDYSASKTKYDPNTAN
ncbi:MAG: hypothetical protein H7328_03065 [Bdellovibrio sp.]|nr:hypothetical protein [Bdellovibrio sp.]